MKSTAATPPKRSVELEKSATPVVIPRSLLSWSPLQENARLLLNWRIHASLNIMAPPRPRLPGPRIAFSRFSAPAGTEQIYSMKPDGGDLRNLSDPQNLGNSPFQDETPAISPATGEIVFSRGKNGN